MNIIATNLGGFARMLCAAYRYFRDNNRKGSIAAVTSVAGTNGIGRLSAYSASKKGAQAYMVALEQLANAEGADVSFTDIRPGWIRTPLLVEGLKYPMEMMAHYKSYCKASTCCCYRLALEYTCRIMACVTKLSVDTCQNEYLNT